MAEKKSWWCAAELRNALASYLPTVRWYRDKSREILSLTVDDAVPCGESYFLLVVSVQFGQGISRLYSLPVRLVPDGDESSLSGSHSLLTHEGGAIVNASEDGGFADALMGLIRSSGSVRGETFEIRGRSTEGLDRGGANDVVGRLFEGQQSNTSFVFGTKYLLKLFRGMEAGPNPEVEIPQRLESRGSFGRFPRLLGQVEFRQKVGPWGVLGVVQAFVPNSGDAFTAAVKSVSSAAGGEFSQRMALLGQRTGEMHLALADSADPEFMPQAFDEVRTAEHCQSLLELMSRSFAALRTAVPLLPKQDQAPAARVLSEEGALLRSVEQWSSKAFGGALIRVHGDFHLGQVLCVGDDFVILDFEGEPGRSLAQRRMKRSPLADVAGMLRSLDYAAASANLVGQEKKGSAWQKSAVTHFLESYYEVLAASPLLPMEASKRATLLSFLTLEKALYELGYELDNRPDWVAIPLRGLVGLLPL